ncbi:MAG TPA: DUF1800 family protein, partial [Bacteroidia bacterium]|nr:DUF1800 family protein [Bacteroidia bacterium]
NFNGDDIINILLEQKQTALYITTKIYREFVNPKLNEKRIEILADDFFASGYDISKLMHSVFSSGWFYDDENIGTKIISPTEMIVRYAKLINMEFEKEEALLGLQKILGQILFFPPNVAGWKGGETWIDSASLMARLNLPYLISTGMSEEFRSKPEFEESPQFKQMKKKMFNIKSDWMPLVNSFSGVKENNLAEEVTDALIQCDRKKINFSEISRADNSTVSKYITGVITNVMSLPEFQLI